jgi:hypothetical protein
MSLREAVPLYAQLSEGSARHVTDRWRTMLARYIIAERAPLNVTKG